MNYDPKNWYWLADDGRLYSSAAQALIANDDIIYLAWRDGGGSPTPWPRDEAGEQTDAALQAVLAPHGLFVDLVAYALNKRWEMENGGIVIAGLPVATDDRSKLMIMGSRIAAEASADWSTVWSGADGGSYPINAAAMIAISDAVEAHVNGIFSRFAQVKADIEAGEITTTGEIDAAFAA